VEYAQKVAATMRDQGIRVEVDGRNEKIGYKIRAAQLQKVPYTLVVGDKEVENANVAVRQRSKGDIGVQPTNQFIATLLQEIASKTDVGS